MRRAEISVEHLQVLLRLAEGVADLGIFTDPAEEEALKAAREALRDAGADL